MKIKTATKSYDEVMAIKPKKRIKPKRPNILFRTVLKVGSLPDLIAVRFKLKKIGMDRLDKKEPCLILMNHSSFIDLKIASSVLYPRAYNIVCTSDGFVGKRWLMRNLGCIPTQKFVSDVALVRDMIYATKTLKSSILMFPEASYSFDGTATPLPDTIGKCIKLLGVPV
ncbi:MAG: 1-acyl-sn-glycerol-3-phosphate acyltransferase, partial [Clostridia bacterium]|nr:1-acyl-sn-glycerol-3-phosphate acyltransferase [Clostridia bacterium]